MPRPAQFNALLEATCGCETPPTRTRWRARLAAAAADSAGWPSDSRCKANGVFAIARPGVVARLRETIPFYVWDASNSEVRWMCAWDTSEADIDDFAATLARLVG